MGHVHIPTRLSGAHWNNCSSKDEQAVIRVCVYHLLYLNYKGVQIFRTLLKTHLQTKSTIDITDNGAIVMRRFFIDKQTPTVRIQYPINCMYTLN